MQQRRSRNGSPIRSSGSQTAHPDDETGSLIMISGMGQPYRCSERHTYASMPQSRSLSSLRPAIVRRHCREQETKTKKNVSLGAFFLRGWDGSIAKFWDQDIGDVALWRRDAVSRCFGSLYFWCLGLWRWGSPITRRTEMSFRQYFVCFVHAKA